MSYPTTSPDEHNPLNDLATETGWEPAHYPLPNYDEMTAMVEFTLGTLERLTDEEL